MGAAASGHADHLAIDGVLTRNPHHRGPRDIVSWDIWAPDRYAGGLTDSLETAGRHLFGTMPTMPEGAEGVIRYAYITGRSGLEYGPPLVRIRSDEETGAVILDEPGEEYVSPADAPAG